MSHSLLLGGRVFDLRSGRAGGAGSDQELETLGASIDRLEKEFGGRQGVHIHVQPALQSDHKFLRRCWVDKAPADMFSLVDVDGGMQIFNTSTDLFQALRGLITQYSLEWTE